MSADHRETNLDLLYGPPWIWAAAVVVVIAAHCLVARRTEKGADLLRPAAEVIMVVVAIAPLVCIVLSFAYLALPNRLSESPSRIILLFVILLLVFAPQNLLTVPMYIASRTASLPHLILLLFLAFGFQIGGIWLALHIDF
jgi:small-conductance mechanosensitive channel